jgi:hypothetical protein
MLASYRHSQDAFEVHLVQSKNGTQGAVSTQVKAVGGDISKIFLLTFF